MRGAEGADINDLVPGSVAQPELPNPSESESGCYALLCDPCSSEVTELKYW